MNIDKFSLLQCGEETLKKFDIQARSKAQLITTINDAIYHKCARTSREKYDVLELRDKILKLIRYEINSNQSEQSVEVILLGTCQDMCPEKERYSREFLSLTSKWEMLNDQIDYRLMIKEYSRSSADQDLPLPNELRPIDVLYETMIFIIDEIISKIASDNVAIDEADWYDRTFLQLRQYCEDCNSFETKKGTTSPGTDRGRSAKNLYSSASCSTTTTRRMSSIDPTRTK
jgi:hypothetical protein